MVELPKPFETSHLNYFISFSFSEKKTFCILLPLRHDCNYIFPNFCHLMAEKHFTKINTFTRLLHYSSSALTLTNSLKISCALLIQSDWKSIGCISTTVTIHQANQSQ